MFGIMQTYIHTEYMFGILVRNICLIIWIFITIYHYVWRELYARDKYETNGTDLWFFRVAKEKASERIAWEPTTDIQYKVVEIKAGDSLWSIAKENMSDELNHSGFTDIYQYIHEIKKCNNMKSNQINAGCYLMVPYYK